MKTVDLVTINDAAKALKQKTVMFYHNYLFGLDNIDGYLIYTNLTQLLQDDFSYNNGIIFDSKLLSAFVKTISSESEFDINNKYIKTFLGDTALELGQNIMLQRMIDNKVVQLMDNRYTNEINITKDIETVYSMKKADGTYYYMPTVNGTKYFITLFSGLLPLNKSDKVNLQICDLYDNKFIAKFTVMKKKIDIYIYLAYLKV